MGPQVALNAPHCLLPHVIDKSHFYVMCDIAACDTPNMADHQKEIEDFGKNDDFWLFGYGY